MLVGVLSYFMRAKIMPKHIKIAILALIISLISTLVAVVFDGLEFEEVSFSEPAILGTNVLWALVIAWVIWDLYRGKDIKWTLILVGLIMIFSLVWDIATYGFGLAQGFYALEIIMFAVAYIYTQSGESREWFDK